MKYFHSQAFAHKRNNYIRSLVFSDGVSVYDKEGMGNVVLDYFTNLFSKSNVECSGVVELIGSIVSSRDNDNLLSYFIDLFFR